MTAISAPPTYLSRRGRELWTHLAPRIRGFRRELDGAALVGMCDARALAEHAEAALRSGKRFSRSDRRLLESVAKEGNIAANFFALLMLVEPERRNHLLRPNQDRKSRGGKVVALKVNRTQ